MINRDFVTAQFKKYSSKYDISMLKIQLKVEHTYRVADLCDRISDSLNLSPSDKDLAWLIGMLHDIARFEQVRIYDSYNDAETVDHAQFGADLLFRGNTSEVSCGSGNAGESDSEICSEETCRPNKSTRLIDDYVRAGELSEDDFKILELAIRNHNKYRVNPELTDRERMFADIIRDADKIDIIKANTDFPIWEVYNVSEEEMRKSSVTAEVLEAFNEGHAVLRSLKKTPADNIIGHVSLAYELVYPQSRKAIKELGYLDKLLAFRTENPETELILREVKMRIYEFLDKE